MASADVTYDVIQTQTHAEPVDIRVMTLEDYEAVFRLWEKISGFAMRSLDDSKPYIERFLRRNPTTSCVALIEGRIVGAILCGHDGRQGSFYHVCVEQGLRKRGIGSRMVRFCLQALAEEYISKVSLIAFDSNESGNRFWQSIGWRARTDCNTYEFVLNEANTTRYID